MRSNGNCEACDKPAPFLKKNDNPYLEVHHIKELSKNGSDSPKNVAAICPNCHARITHGKNATNFNEKLKKKILNMEDDLSSIS